MILILAQAAHSIEEYSFKLYDVFGPARFVSRVVSEDLPTGFAVVNIGLVAFGLWCYLARVRPAHVSARRWVWPWVFVEGANGMGHPLIALGRGEYFPGVWTAPLLAVLSLYLGIRLVRAERRRSADV